MRMLTQRHRVYKKRQKNSLRKINKRRYLNAVYNTCERKNYRLKSKSVLNEHAVSLLPTSSPSPKMNYTKVEEEGN